MKKSVSKKGQLTLFIVLAIVIVLSIVIYFYTESTKESLTEKFVSGKGLTEEMSAVRTNVFDCIDRTTKDALITIGVQGGYYTPSEKYYTNKDLTEKNSFFSYFYYEGDYLMPSKEKIQNSISKYIESNINECFDSKIYPTEIDFSNAIIKTEIKEKEVEITISLRLTIYKEDSASTIEIQDEKFSYESYLQGMIEIAEYLTDYHKTDPKYYCVNCLGTMAYERKVNVDIVPFIESNTFQVIIHENRTNQPNLYIFNYLNKYTGNEVSPVFNY